MMPWACGIPLLISRHIVKLILNKKEILCVFMLDREKGERQTETEAPK